MTLNRFPVLHFYIYLYVSGVCSGESRFCAFISGLEEFNRIQIFVTQGGERLSFYICNTASGCVDMILY